MVEVLIPTLQKKLAMFFHQPTDRGQFVRPETARPFQGDRVQPVLRHHSFASNMHVRRFRLVQGHKKEPIRTDREDCGHFVDSNCQSPQYWGEQVALWRNPPQRQILCCLKCQMSSRGRRLFLPRLPHEIGDFRQNLGVCVNHLLVDGYLEVLVSLNIWYASRVKGFRCLRKQTF